MPKRTVLDASGRAVYRTTQAQIAPATFQVELDACGSVPGEPGTPIVEWRWQIEHDPVLTASQCTRAVQLPEGTYRVWTSVVDSDGVESLPILRHVVVQDWLIVAFGDSYGAGEGAPDANLQLADLAPLEAAWGNFGAKLNDVAVKAADVTAKLTDFQETQAKYNAFVFAYARWENDPNPDNTLAVLAAAADLGITAITNVGTNLFNAAVAVRDTAEAAWDAAVAAWEVAVAAVTTARQAIDTIKAGLSADWQDRLCHRSGNSGAFQAARALEDLDPRTSVTLVHLACTGATILEGIIGNYLGSDSEKHLHAAPGLPPQPIEATQLVAGREVDAIYVSIGGNDAQFANLVKACMIQPHCYDDTKPAFPGVTDTAAAANQVVNTLCSPFLALNTVLPTTMWGECLTYLQDGFIQLPELLTMTAKEIFAIGINGGTFDGEAQLPLATRYAMMDEFIFNHPSVKLLRPDRRNRLHISEYPDLSRDQNGAYCHNLAHGIDAIPGWSDAETSWADTFLTPSLNAAIQQSATTLGWTFVTGVAAGYNQRGYCSTNRFIVQLQESILNQAQIDGAVHPNAGGFGVYGAQILQSLLPQLYPVAGPTLGRDLTQPRRPDQVPFTYTGGDRTMDEGEVITLANDSWDGDGDVVRWEWTHNAAPNVAELDPLNGRAREPQLRAFDNGTFGLTLTAADEDTDWFGTHPLPSVSGTATVRNVAPEVGAITAPVEPVPIGQQVTASAPFSDPGVLDAPFTAAWTFGDGSTATCTSNVPVLTGSTCEVADANGSGTATATHVYTSPGIYTVRLTITDKDNGSTAAEDFRYVVVYDPDGPFVTGAGRIYSQPGAYPADPTVEGDAKFGFQSQYKKGATVPVGKTDFSFEAAGFAFHSSTYQWLVVSGSRATYKGTGTVNGQPGYGFFLTAVDGDRDATKKHDRLRLRVWDLATDATVYDNLNGASIDTDIRAHDGTIIKLGQIVIHDNKAGK